MKYLENGILEALMMAHSVNPQLDFKENWVFEK